MKETEELSPNSPTLSEILKSPSKVDNVSFDSQKSVALEQILKSKELQRLGMMLEESMKEDVSKNVIDPNPSELKGLSKSTKFTCLTYKNGDKYEGVLSNLSKKGIGKMIFINGMEYYGSFNNDQIDGDGRITFPEKSDFEVYKGDFVKNRFEGQGELKYKNGNNYNGQFLKNQFSGLGVFTYKPNENNNIPSANQDDAAIQHFTFTGKFLNGTFHGYGNINFPDHSMFFGEWENGIQINEGNYLTSEGLQFKGVLEENREENNKFLNNLPKQLNEKGYEDIEKKANKNKGSNSTSTQKRKINTNKIEIILLIAVICFIILKLYGYFYYPSSHQWNEKNSKNYTIDTDHNAYKSYFSKFTTFFSHFFERRYEFESSLPKTEVSPSRSEENTVKNNILFESNEDNAIFRKNSFFRSVNQQLKRI